MMLPKEIKEARFSRAFKGYSDKEVDEFLNKVLEDYGQLYRDNAELEHKIEILADKIREYKENEQALEDAKKKVLRMAQEKVIEAKDEAIRIERDAKEKAERILIDAKREAERERRNYERLQLEITRFKNKAINLFKTEIDQLNNLPSLQVSPQEMLRIQTETIHEEAPKQEENLDAVSFMRKAQENKPETEAEKPAPLPMINEDIPDTPADMDIFGNSLNFEEKTDIELEKEKKTSSFTLNIKASEPEEEVISKVAPFEGIADEQPEEAEEKTLVIDTEPIEAIQTEIKEGEDTREEKLPKLSFEEAIRADEQAEIEEKIKQATQELAVQEDIKEADAPKFIRVENREIDNLVRRGRDESDSSGTRVFALPEEEDVRPINDETGNFEIIDIDGNSKSSHEHKENAEHPRFGQLRFGDDYDLESDDFGGSIFKRKKKKKD